MSIPIDAVPDMERFKDKIAELLQQFEQCFQIFGELEKDFKVFCLPFTVIPSDLPINIQLEIIDLQCDSDLKGKFSTAGFDTFYQNLCQLQSCCPCLEPQIVVSRFFP